MKKKAMEYDDPWKRFKVHILKQVPYFKDLDDDFFEDVHNFMQEENFEKGTEIFSAGEQSSKLMFVTEGFVNLIISDKEGNKFTLDTL